MLFMIILVAVAICIYWDWEAHAPEKVCPDPVCHESVPLSASIRKYEVREKQAS